MSNRESVVNKGPLVNKLREGLQETVVFLRTLASYKIPAVIERRRKELLDKLCLLQGNTLKDAPPVIEPPEDPKYKATLKERPLPTKEIPTKERSSSESATKDREDRGDSPASTSSVTSPSKLSKRDSKIVNLIKDYESIHHSAKKEEVDETPKRLVTLKKVAKPVDYRHGSAPPEEEVKEDEKKEGKEGKAKAEVTNGVTTDSAEPDTLEVHSSRECTLSVVSTEDGLDEAEGEESEKGSDKKKKKGKLGFGFKGKRKRDKSPAPERSPVPEMKAAPAEPAAEEEADQPNDEEEEEVQLAEGVRICGVLERNKKKGIGGHKKVKIDAKVFHTKLILGGGKEELDLANSSLEETESGFDLTHPQRRSVMVFKVDGPEDEKQRWVAVLKEAIAEATPAKEEEVPEEVVPSPEVPSITVNDTSSQQTKPNKRDSKAMNVIKKLVPDQGVALKGYIHRKKLGLGRSWEKIYCVLTYQAMYFTGMEDNKDYSGMLSIYPNAEAKLSETNKGKGHDKHSQVPGLTLKLGKKVEQFSFDSQSDFRDWKDAIERVLGIGGVEELLSEDEELDGAIDEDLYEELEPDFIPPVPDSPRPSRPNVPVIPQDDDIMIDEDIYEETDDLLPAISSYSYQPAPALPDRNAPNPLLPDRNTPKHVAPAPSLPPRSGPATLPGLPPHNPTSPRQAAIPNPQEYEATNAHNKPAAVPAPSADDEELYDDVLVGDSGVAEEDELYDDVVVGEAVEEELYDDIVAVTTGVAEEPIQDEFYEDMAPGTPDPYVTMEKNGEGEEAEDEELYVDVEEPVASSNKKPQQKQLDTAKQTNAKSGTFSRMFQKKSVSGGKAGICGALAYKAPKKSKFEDKWGVVEGNSLLIYKSSSDKRSQDKVMLGDCKLEIGSREAGAGKSAFRLNKGEKTYHFSFKEASELEEWVGVIKGLVKYAVETKEGGVDREEDVYEAREDHIADSDGELTFKKGTYIRLLSRESSDVWVGQIGTDNRVFEGKVGKFPASKVQLAEDLYF